MGPRPWLCGQRSWSSPPSCHGSLRRPRVDDFKPRIDRAGVAARVAGRGGGAPSSLGARRRALAKFPASTRPGASKENPPPSRCSTPRTGRRWPGDTGLLRRSPRQRGRVNPSGFGSRPCRRLRLDAARRIVMSQAASRNAAIRDRHWRPHPCRLPAGRDHRLPPECDHVARKPQSIAGCPAIRSPRRTRGRGTRWLAAGRGALR
jgi:hypothetical protein